MSELSDVGNEVLTRTAFNQVRDSLDPAVLAALDALLNPDEQRP